VTTAQPSVERSVSNRPVALANEPMARFQPPFVETSVQRSMTRQLRIVHGKTGTNAQAVAIAPIAIEARRRGGVSELRIVSAVNTTSAGA
jgi:hypothetical protein